MATKEHQDSSQKYGFLQRNMSAISVGAGVVVLLGLAAGLAWGAASSPAGGETFRFISLVILFMAATTLAAAVFVGLGLQNPAEAFGLPLGSMRAMLAIGIMILFVVFGLPMVSPDGAQPLPPRIVTVPFDRLATEVAFHREQGLQVRVVDYGRPAVAPAPPTDARIEIFGRLDARTPAEIDFGKQMLTAIVTLLTTVVGFYFGSRSASEAISGAAEERNRGRDGSGGGGGAAAGGGDFATMRTQLHTGLAGLTSAYEATRQRMAEIENDPATAQTPARGTALGEAKDLSSRAEATRQELERELSAADAAAAAAEGATAAADRARHEAAAKAHLQKAAALLTAAQQAHTQLTEKLGSIH